MLHPESNSTESFFRNTFDYVAVGIAQVSPEGKFLRINQHFSEIIGYSASEMIGNTFQSITHPDDLEEDLDLIQQLLDGKIPSYSMEKRYLHKQGHIVWVHLTVSIIRSESGEPDYFISVVKDITDRKKAEKALVESEERYKSLVEQANDGIVIIQEGLITYANEALLKLTGFEADEMIGQSFLLFIEEGQRQLLKENYIKRAKGEPVPSIYETAILHKEGYGLDVEVNAGLTILNGKATEVVIIRDIGLRIREQQKLKDSDGRFRALYDHAGFALGMAKSDTRKNELVNQVWIDMFGYKDASEVLEKSVMEFVAPESRALVAKYAQLRQEGKDAPLTYEIRGLRKDGSTFDMEMRISTYTYEEELYTIAMIMDITERKNVEKERDRMFDLSSDLIAISGFDGYFKHLNPAWEKVMGYKISELKERPFISFIHPNDLEKTSEEVKKLSQGIPTIHFEVRHVTKDGEIRYFSWKATPLVENKLIYGIARDITESKEAEEKILTYQKRLKELGTEMTLNEEKQRKQMATELHDHVGQLLASSRLQIAALREEMEKDEIHSKMQDISSGLLQAIQATRTAIFNLSPPQLNEIGLFAATADWMEEQIEGEYGIHARITGDNRVFPINEKIRLLVFRCIRELLMNVVKHARATRVEVEFRDKQKQLQIIVSDNGKGFNYHPDLVRLRNTGFGLFSILERMQDLGGSMEIDSKSGIGTIVVMLIPFKTGEA